MSSEKTHENFIITLELDTEKVQYKEIRDRILRAFDDSQNMRVIKIATDFDPNPFTLNDPDDFPFGFR